MVIVNVVANYNQKNECITGIDSNTSDPRAAFWSRGLCNLLRVSTAVGLAVTDSY